MMFWDIETINEKKIRLHPWAQNSYVYFCQETKCWKNQTGGIYLFWETIDRDDWEIYTEPEEKKTKSETFNQFYYSYVGGVSGRILMSGLTTESWDEWADSAMIFHKAEKVTLDNLENWDGTN